MAGASIPVGPLAPAQVAVLLASSTALLEAEIRALGDQEAAWHPAPGEWCIIQTLVGGPAGVLAELGGHATKR